MTTVKFFVALVAVVLLAATRPADAASCAAVPSTNAIVGFSAAAAGCTDVLRCRREWCTCIGGTAASNQTPSSDSVYGGFNETCLSIPLRTCAFAGACVASFAECMNNVSQYANNATNGNVCRSWGATLQTQLLQIYSESKSYRETTLPAACEVASCPMITLATRTDDSGISQSCLNVACKSPVQSAFKARIRGKFNRFFDNDGGRETRLAALKAAFENDCFGKLKVRCFVTSIVSGSIIVSFTTDTSNTNTDLVQAVTEAATNASWLTETTALYVSETGESSSDITVASLVDETDASAASSDSGDGLCASDSCKAGVAIGVTAGLLIIIAIIYSCCCSDKGVRSNRVADESKAARAASAA